LLQTPEKCGLNIKLVDGEFSACLDLGRLYEPVSSADLGPVFLLELNNPREVDRLRGLQEAKVLLDIRDFTQQLSMPGIRLRLVGRQCISLDRYQ
jgi:hypothetical protein